MLLNIRKIEADKVLLGSLWSRSEVGELDRTFP